MTYLHIWKEEQALIFIPRVSLAMQNPEILQIISLKKYE